ncbi:three-Cys-motif partner protein TcmP [Zobellia nedashkovskayae]|uniref:three-Cys-motif partner protein TcmP n=1 Tax=Zobellia nedashkovskayae TaxID=2779510 RepID=UPI00188D4D62|nr:three-Cys-motif partner protein TcmP [Zobellia nedashkovskayae]
MATLSKTNLLNHSEAKVKLFGDYIQKYLNIISNDKYTTDIHLYDLFCGPGIYDNGGEGSPIIALKKIKDTHFKQIKSKGNNLKINCYFNDIDEEKISSLSENIKNNKLYYSSFGSLNLTSKDYLNIIQELPKELSKYKNEKAFIFIDPYGYKEVKAEHILNLLECKKKSEVLLWLPIQHMYRFSKNGTPSVLDNFNTQLGINKDSISNEWDYIGFLKEGFQEYIGNNFFVDSFSLKKEENTVFCLFFFSSHIRGYEKMLETKWQIDKEQGKGWEYSGNQPTLFSEIKTNPLEEDILKFLKETPRKNGEIYEFTLRKGFLTTHATQVLKKIQSLNKISTVEKDGSKARKGSFYINYENYKNNFDRITVKRIS